MNGLKSFIAGVTVALPAVCVAGDLPWLTFRMTDNSELSVAADNLTISYSDRVLQLKSATVDQLIPVDQVRSMQFTSVSAELCDIIGDALTGVAEFYDLSGKKLGSYASVDDARAALPSGVYVVKWGDKSLKVIF